MSSLRFLTTPAKLASALDWKKFSGSILALDIGRDRLGVAVAGHPSFGEPVQELESVPVELETRASNSKQRTLAPEVISRLQRIVKEHNVCGFVVSWPVQKEGRCGAACGRVLHTLDSIVAEESYVVSSKRLFCLWDGEHVTPKEDAWGRCPMYGNPSTKTLHVASREQYKYESSSSAAADVYNDFCRAQWPELHRQQHDGDGYDSDDIRNRGSEFCDSELLENYEDSSAYMKAAAF